MVSVIMPSYNSEGYITDAIRSVLSQTYKDIELIICDDASSDNTAKTITETVGSDPRVKIIHKTENSGVAKTRNAAIEQAVGRYIAFLDSDDIWKQEKLRTQIEFIKESECAVCYSSYGFINATGDLLNNKSAGIKENADYHSLLKDNFIGMLTVVIDRNKTGEIVFSNERHEDLILWLNLAKNSFSLLGLNDILALYRVSGESLSGNKKKAAKWRWQVYRNSEKFSIFKSLWYMTFYTINALKKRI